MHTCTGFHFFSHSFASTVGLLYHAKGLRVFLVDCTEPNTCDFPPALGIFSSIKSLIPAEPW